MKRFLCNITNNDNVERIELVFVSKGGTSRIPPPFPTVFRQKIQIGPQNLVSMIHGDRGIVKGGRTLSIYYPKILRQISQLLIY